jgi:hypothetical protein
MRAGQLSRWHAQKLLDAAQPWFDRYSAALADRTIDDAGRDSARALLAVLCSVVSTQLLRHAAGETAWRFGQRAKRAVATLDAGDAAVRAHAARARRCFALTSDSVGPMRWSRSAPRHSPTTPWGACRRGRAAAHRSSRPWRCRRWSGWTTSPANSTDTAR